MIKRMAAVLTLMFLCSGCIKIQLVRDADQSIEDSVKLVETDFIPRQLLEAKAIKVRAFRGGKYVVTNEKLQGYYAISPALYKKLVKVAAENAKLKAEIVELRN